MPGRILHDIKFRMLKQAKWPVSSTGCVWCKGKKNEKGCHRWKEIQETFPTNTIVDLVWIPIWTHQLQKAISETSEGKLKMNWYLRVFYITEIFLIVILK